MNMKGQTAMSAKNAFKPKQAQQASLLKKGEEEAGGAGGASGKAAEPIVQIQDQLRAISEALNIKKT